MPTALAAAPARRDAFAELVHTIQPSLLGMTGGRPAAYDLPRDLLAGLVVWDPTAPVTQRETNFPFPAPQGFRRTLVDLMINVPSGPVAAVPSFTTGDPAEPHDIATPKVESGLTFSGAQEQLKSVATWIRLTDELAEDAAGLQPWLEAFLDHLVKAGEEAEVLNGTRGFMVRSGIPAYSGSATEMSDILAEMLGQAAASGLEPDTMVLSSADWGTVMQTGGSAVDATASMFLGCDVVRSPALTTGEALVGACQSAAVVLRNGTIMVEGTRSHDDDFAKNISMIRAASRIALGVLAPDAFVKTA